MEHRKQVEHNTVERRAFNTGIEVRAADGKNRLRGYAARFGSVYDMGWFTEEVSRRAFENADLSDVRILFNHDSNQILGRTASGTARVGIDENGLWYEVDLPDSPMGENVRVAVERGDVTQSSWGFTLKKDSWERREGKDHRVLETVDMVFDASPVTFPANPDTSVAKRSMDAWQAGQGPQVDDNSIIETELDIALLERQRHNHIIKTQVR